MIHNSHRLSSLHQTGDTTSPARSLDDLIACARNSKLYEGPDAAELPEVIQERLNTFLKHALQSSGGAPQRCAVRCTVSPLSPGNPEREPQEIVEYDFDFDLGTNQTIIPRNYRYIDDRQRIELGVIQRKDWPQDLDGPWLYWPEELIELFRRIPGEDNGTYHTYQTIQVVIDQSDRASKTSSLRHRAGEAPRGL